MSRLIDADGLLERVGRCRLDTREAIVEMIQNEPTVCGTCDETCDQNCEVEELKAALEWQSRENERLKGQVHALAFALRCNGVSGNEVTYENY